MRIFFNDHHSKDVNYYHGKADKSEREERSGACPARGYKGRVPKDQDGLSR